jgi:aryl-alcohol dehydrogenase-like predicted oxidoreductase
MEKRSFGPTGREVSVIGQGCWQFGGDWGKVADSSALEVLEAAVGHGVSLLDTADVYGDGRSERLVGRFVASRGGADAAGITVITKMGRRADPFVPEAFTYENFRAWIDRSRKNLGMDSLHLVQLHCPPTSVYGSQRLYDDLDRLVESGSIAAYGVSVETCAEALEAMEHPGVASVQIILNVFRRKPLDEVLPTAAKKGVAIIARVPLASGLLSGRFDENSSFAPEDHRSYNRHGEAFDVGETFAGVPYELGVRAARVVREIAQGLPGSPTTAQTALRWVMDQPGVSVVIPGASKPEQAAANAEAAAQAPLPSQALTDLEALYDDYVREYVADRW